MEQALSHIEEPELAFGGEPGSISETTDTKHDPRPEEHEGLVAFGQARSKSHRRIGLRLMLALLAFRRAAPRPRAPGQGGEPSPQAVL